MFRRILGVGLAVLLAAVLFVVGSHAIASAAVDTSATQKPTARAATDPVDRSGIAKWAVTNATWGGWDPMFIGTDCTDFVSRALHFGGGLREVTPPAPQQTNHDNDRTQWYDDVQVRLSPWLVGSSIRHTYAKTWSEAPWSFEYQLSRGGRVVPRSAVQVGDVAYVNLHGSSSDGIDHAAIVTKVTATNVYIAQQSNPNQYSPIFDSPNAASWQSTYPHMTPFFVDPSAER
jgi:cell wall-associated NlpC family hydrolase